MSYELDIVLFNICLTTSGISWKQITLGYIYILIVNEWTVSKTKVETHIFTYNQFGSPPLTVLNETACISW